MISKTLLSEILGYKVNKVSLLNKDKAHINVTGNTEKYTPNTMPYSIYELAHKCKEWALNQGYWISSWLATDLQARAEIEDMETDKIIDRYTGTSEPEAVFKACEWILENK